MEDWGASTQAPSQFSVERIDACDLCILLVGRRRGHIPRDKKRSITQLEYYAARERGIDVLAFVLADNTPWPKKFDESATDPEFQRWRDELLETRGVERFGADPRSVDVAPAVTRWVLDRQLSDLAAHRRPQTTPWNPKVVRLGRLYGLLSAEGGSIDFSTEVAASLHRVGDDWIKGKPLKGSSTVLAGWAEYSTMAIVVATKPGTVLAEDLQELMYTECQHQLIQLLMDLALQSEVMVERGGRLSVANDVNDEMMDLLTHSDQVAAYSKDATDPKAIAMLAFVDIVRARLLLHAPQREPYAEALGTLILSNFGFWRGPAKAGRNVAAIATTQTETLRTARQRHRKADDRARASPRLP